MSRAAVLFFSPLFLILCTVTNNQDEKRKSFHVLFEDDMVQDPGRGKGLIME